MKILTLAAAGMMALTGLAPAALTTAASAQHRVVHERTVVHTERHDHHRVHHRYSTRRVCRNEWRHHHRVRVCRTVRYAR